ncbi:hypothetical protein B0A48_00103 [Cryoendolithus antarcticus]|uniref:Uncharacterized protein n=1 Tax=Cryoendolithus antarcticus TaxID=1507870 RepID=A0A1V8TU68_9PEZI|nr:hypothetical protein B0A48_00103 [Cryoendolithus antarcticus]
MTVATANTDSTFDAPLDRLQILVITSPWSSDRTSAAARVLGIPELLENILIISAELLEAELVADEYGSSHFALSPRDMCWLFRAQTVSKTFARTIPESRPLQKAMSRTYRPVRTDRLSIRDRDTIGLNPLFFRRYLQSKFHAKPRIDYDRQAYIGPRLRFMERDMKKFAAWVQATKCESWASTKCTSSPCDMYVEVFPWIEHARPSTVKLAGRFRIEDPTIGEVGARIAQMYEIAHPRTMMWADPSTTTS